MNDPMPKAGNRKDQEIAAADWLLEETPSPDSARAGGPVILPASGEGFELAGPAPGAEAAQSGTAEVGQPADVRQRAREALPPKPAVEQVWSRAAEWGPTLLALGGWIAALLWLLYLSLNSEAYNLAAILVVIACAGALVLSYPILITLERPVRITPEQAARDYFGALSHHLPHYRRMWLLLSARGRTSAEYTSYEQFKKYWIERLAQLKNGHVSRLTPLVFQVEEFQAEKSAGRTEIDARFQLRISVRGRRDQGPIHSVPMERTFARGPDGMWYLEDGTLPRPGAAAHEGGHEHRPG
jgi:hypothetical protein